MDRVASSSRRIGSSSPLNRIERRVANPREKNKIDWCCISMIGCCVACEVLGCAKTVGLAGAVFLGWLYSLPPLEPVEIQRWIINGNIIRILRKQENGELTLVYPHPITKIEQQKALVLQKPSSYLYENENQFFERPKERIQQIFFTYFLPVIEHNQVIFTETAYECSFNKRLVRFFQLQDEVVYQHNNQQGSVPIDKEILPIALQIEYIKACLVRVSEQGILSITPKLQLVYQWESPTKLERSFSDRYYWRSHNPYSYPVSLVKEDNSFFWEIQRFGNDILHIYTDSFDTFFSGSIENSDNHFGNFNLNVFLDNHQVSSIKLEKISAKSHLDSTKKVNPDLWAVTLIDKGRSGLDPLTWGGHAMIVIEGVRIPEDSKRARYFMELADAVGNREVVDQRGARRHEPPAIRFFSDKRSDPKKLGYVSKDNKSQTFLIDRYNAEYMIKRIQEEANSPFSFNIFSNNCAIWALRTLEVVGITLSEKPLIYTPTSILHKLAHTGLGELLRRKHGHQMEILDLTVDISPLSDDESEELT